MSLFSRVTTWVANQILTSSTLNGEFNNLVNGLNNLDGATTTWTNVKVSTLTVTGTASFASATSPFTNWVAYTPTVTGCGTVANMSAFWKQVGDDLFVRGRFKCGTVTGAVFSITIPATLSIDYTKIPSGVSTVVGLFRDEDNGAGPTNQAAIGLLNAITDGTQTGTIYAAFSSGNSDYNKAVGTTWNTSDGVPFSFSVPIVGWTF